MKNIRLYNLTKQTCYKLELKKRLSIKTIMRKSIWVLIVLVIILIGLFLIPKLRIEPTLINPTPTVLPTVTPVATPTVILEILKTPIKKIIVKKVIN